MTTYRISIMKSIVHRGRVLAVFHEGRKWYIQPGRRQSNRCTPGGETIQDGLLYIKKKITEHSHDDL